MFMCVCVYVCVCAHVCVCIIASMVNMVNIIILCDNVLPVVSLIEVGPISQWRLHHARCPTS